MKKSLIAAVTLALCTASSSASAIDTTEAYSMRVAGNFPLSSMLSAPNGIQFHAAGAPSSSPRVCVYLMTWESPFNPNRVEQCVVAETTSPTFPSCARNATRNIAAYVEAGLSSGALGMCGGFDSLGNQYDNVVLLLGEVAGGGSFSRTGGSGGKTGGLGSLGGLGRGRGGAGGIVLTGTAVFKDGPVNLIHAIEIA